MADATCELCNTTGGTLLWQNDLCRVVAVEDGEYPGFVRIIAARHVREMTDLSEAERSALMGVVFTVESAMRETMQPDKMNLASLGNMTPHVHWHVIPRFRDDRHFPGPVWSEPKRDAGVPAERVERARELERVLRARLGAARS